MDSSTSLALLGFVVPGLIGLAAGIGAAALKRMGSSNPSASSAARRDEGFIGARVLAIVGLTAGLFVSMFGVGGPPTWSFTAMEGNLPLIAPVIGAIGLAGVLLTAWKGARSAGGERGFGWRVSWIGAFVGAAGATLVALGRPLWSGTLVAGGVVWVPVVFGLWAAISAASIGGIARGGGRVSAAIILAGLALALGGNFLCTSGQEMGEYGLGAAAVCGAWAAGLLIMRGSPGPGAVLVMSAAMAALLACAVVRINTPWWQCGVLGAAAPCAYVADVLAARRLKPLAGACVRIGVAAVVAAAAVVPDAIVLARMVKNGEV